MGMFNVFERVLDVVVCMAALYVLSYSSLFLFYLFLLLPLALIFEEEGGSSLHGRGRGRRRDAAPLLASPAQ